MTENKTIHLLNLADTNTTTIVLSKLGLKKKLFVSCNGLKKIG